MKTKILVEQERRKRESATKPPPKLLGDLIERVQKLTPNVDLSPLSEKSVDAHNWLYSGGRSVRYTKPSEKWTENARLTLYNNLKDLPREFQEYIWDNAIPERHPLSEFSDSDFDISGHLNSTRQAVERYEDFLRLREQFHYVALFAFRHPSWEQQFEKSKRENPSKQMRYMLRLHRERKSPFGNRQLPFFGSTRFEMDENATVEAKPDEFGEAFKPKVIKKKVEKVDARRIRECAACGQIIWAGRTDQFCCLKGGCRGAFNSRLNRAENKTEKERRADNDKKSLNRDYRNKKSFRP